MSDIDLSKETVFILGAGFTKAFVPSAPLLIDKYGLDTLLTELGAKHMLRGRELLQSELDAFRDGRVNLERLMTRLEGRMPYDRDRQAESDYTWLHEKVKRVFKAKIEASMPHPASPLPGELQKFARVCVQNRFHCITFNYDDLLDRALFEVNNDSGPPRKWNPDRGYGFPCPSSDIVLHGPHRDFEGPSAMCLLKLHGSLNWRVRYGQPSPYMPDNLVHHEKWFPRRHPSYVEMAEELIDPEPFFVPPVLTKNALVEHPILRLLWSGAFEVLERAKQVVFIGYSMPLTDIGGSFLFRESLRELDPATDITVVGYSPSPSEDGAQLNELTRAYRAVFGEKMPDGHFKVSGAEDWIRSTLYPSSLVVRRL